MRPEVWTAVGALAGVLATVLTLFWQRPKIGAEARKLNADASRTEWSTLRDEINRLQERVERQDERIAELEKLDDERADRERALKKENNQLRQKVRRLETRIKGLEEVFKIGPVPPDMKAALDKLGKID
jgi:peptidoglycan hydrolase CwlO-like protein